MGRPSVVPRTCNEVEKLWLQRLPFVDQSYDKWGAYWGMPANVWIAWGRDLDDGSRIEIFVRADDREDAKIQVVIASRRLSEGTPLRIVKFHR